MNFLSAAEADASFVILAIVRFGSSLRIFAWWPQ